MDVVCIGPQISECTISSGVRALYDFPTGKFALCYLPKMKPSQSLSSLSINGNPFTILFVCSSFNPPKFRCPNLKCHSHESSITSVWNATLISSLSLSFLSQCTHSYLIYALNASPVLSGTILNGNKLFLFIGTFVISWLLGYMSLITQWFSSM